MMHYLMYFPKHIFETSKVYSLRLYIVSSKYPRTKSSFWPNPSRPSFLSEKMKNTQVIQHFVKFKV